MSPAIATDRSGNQPIPRRRLTILVVDDNRDTVLTLTMLLRDEGHEVQGLHDPALALASVKQTHPDVVILDIAMPGQSGYAVAQDIRAQYRGPQPLLIAISGQYIRAPDVLLSRAAGFDHHLIKPCDPNALIALLRPLTRPSADESGSEMSG